MSRKPVTLELSVEEAEEIIAGLSNRTKQKGIQFQTAQTVEALGKRLSAAFDACGLFNNTNPESPWNTLQKREVRMSIVSRNRW